MSITSNDIKCLDCAYEDLGVNGTKECLPQTRSCRPVYPYDMALSSKIRKLDIKHPRGGNGEGASGRVNKDDGGNFKISREG